MEDVMSFTPLGAGQEVGRSCHILEFRGTTVMLDIGIHPGFDGLNGLPFLDRIEPDQIDVLLVTHFHLDHAASLPYLTERTSFKGRIFMTHPTKSVLRLLLGDYLRLLRMNNTDPENVLYTEEELNACIEKIELVDYHTTVTVGGVSFYALNAGHVLGACMFFLHLGGRKILYTGDYSMEQDRHLMAAEIPNEKPDLLIVESTYGVQAHTSRPEREARFTGTVDRIVSRGGRCLIPVFALGRAQELLLILDEYWQANPHLQSIPIWYASKLASRALRVYQTYANMMNARIQAQMDLGNPFQFRYIKNLKSIDVKTFDDTGPAVVFASPGMLQSGVSRQLFDRWASDPKNGVMIAGYAVEGTLAKDIITTPPKEVVTLEGRRQPLNCLVDYVSFSAHVDFVQNRGFIKKVDPKHIVLVHGQRDEMGRLKSALLHLYKQVPDNKRPTITMPPNLQEVKLKFVRRTTAKAMGTLARKEAMPNEGDEVCGVLVSGNFPSKLVAPADLSKFSSLRTGSVTSKLHVPYDGKAQTIETFLGEMFADVRKEVDQEESALTRFHLFGEKVMVSVYETENKAVVEWDASVEGDVLADSVVALLMHAQSSAASIRLRSRPCGQTETVNKRQKVDSDEVSRRMKFVYGILAEHYGTVEATYEARSATFEIITQMGNDESITCNVKAISDECGDMKVEVECENNELSQSISGCLHRTTDLYRKTTLSALQSDEKQ